MDKYYYLIASLPLLKFTEAPFLSGTSFITEAKKWLSPDDFAILSKVDINNFLIDEKDTPLLKKWKECEYLMRRELAFFRRAKREGAEYKIGKDLTSIIQEGSNPLEIEIKLLGTRWNFLSEQEVEHFFDLDSLIIYYLKLQILERLVSFDKEKGKQRFEIYSAVEL